MYDDFPSLGGCALTGSDRAQRGLLGMASLGTLGIGRGGILARRSRRWIVAGLMVAGAGAFALGATRANAATCDTTLKPAGVGVTDEIALATNWDNGLPSSTKKGCIPTYAGRS